MPIDVLAFEAVGLSAVLPDMRQDGRRGRAEALEKIAKKKSSLTMKDSDKLKPSKREVESLEKMSDNELGVAIVMEKEGETPDDLRSPTRLRAAEAEKAKKERKPRKEKKPKKERKAKKRK